MNIKIEKILSVEVLVSNLENYKEVKDFLKEKDVYIKEEFDGTEYSFRKINEEDMQNLAYLIDIVSSEDIYYEMLSLFYDNDFNFIHIKFLENDTRSFI